MSNRSSSTLPGNFSVIKTPLPQPPPLSVATSSQTFSPEMEQYLLSPKMVELLRLKPDESSVPSPGISYQESLLLQKSYANHSRTLSHPNALLRTSTGSSIDSSIMSRRSSEDPEYFSTRFSSSSIDGHSDTNSFTYDTPTNNQFAGHSSHSINVPSHYDVPRSLLGSDRAKLLSNNYMVPRMARMSDPLHSNNYDYLPPPRLANDFHPHYDYLPKRDIPLPPISDIPLPPRSDVPRPKSDVPLTSKSDIPDTIVTKNIYDVPPHPRPLLPLNDGASLCTVQGSPSHSSQTVSGNNSRRQSLDSVDCPTPQDSNILSQQGNVPPPPIIFRKESKEEEMIPNKLYEMVWSNEEFSFTDNSRDELEETLTVTNVDSDGHQYVNLCVKEDEEVPPPVDRSLKPGGPPKIDRSNKPKGVVDSDSITLSESLSESLSVDSNNEEAFSSREIPRLTSHSIHYTQVTFDRKKPVPTPRSNRTPSSSPQRRVNYCHIDIDATNNNSLNDSTAENNCPNYED